MANTTIKAKDEKVTKEGVTVYRNGRLRVVYIQTPAAVSATLNAQDRPPVTIRTLSSIYNGETYVDCYISVETDGQVLIRDYYGGEVINARYGFLINRTIVYSV